VHALVFKFIVEKHEDEIQRFLPVQEKVLTPDELVQVANLVENSDERLFVPYFSTHVLNSDTPVDNVSVNEKFLHYMLRKKMVAELRVAITKVNCYDKEAFAEQLVAEKELRIAAALLFNQIEQYERCTQILIQENEIDLAIEQLRVSKDRKAAARLLEFAAESDSPKL